MLRILVWIFAPQAVVSVLTTFEFAQRRFIIGVPLALCAVTYILGVAHWHGSIMEVMRVMALVMWGALAALLVITFSRLGRIPAYAEK